MSVFHFCDGRQNHERVYASLGGMFLLCCTLHPNLGTAVVVKQHRRVPGAKELLRS